MTPAILRTENRRLEAQVAELREEKKALEQQKHSLLVELETTKRELTLKLQEAEAKLKDLIRRIHVPSSEKMAPRSCSGEGSLSTTIYGIWTSSSCADFLGKSLYVRGGFRYLQLVHRKL